MSTFHNAGGFAVGGRPPISPGQMPSASIFGPGSDPLMRPPLREDKVRTALRQLTGFTELLADEVSAIVMRMVCRESLDWMGRAIFNDQCNLADMMSRTSVGEGFTATGILLPLMGNPEEASPYNTVKYAGEDFDVRMDRNYLTYSPKVRLMVDTGPAYWLARFLKPEPLNSHLRTDRCLDVDAVKTHFFAKNEGLFSGLANSGFGPGDRFFKIAALALSWGLLRGAFEFWVQIAQINAKALGDLLLELEKNKPKLNKKQAQKLFVAIFEPAIELEKGTAGIVRRYRGAWPPSQNFFDRTSKGATPEDGDATIDWMNRCISNFRANLEEDALIFDTLCTHLSSETQRTLEDFPHICFDTPFREVVAAFSRASQTYRELAQNGASNNEFADQFGAELVQNTFLEGLKRHNRLDRADSIPSIAAQAYTESAFYSSLGNWMQYLSSVYAEFERRCMHGACPQQSLGLSRNLGNIIGTGYAANLTLNRPVDRGMACEIAKGMTQLDLSGENKRKDELAPHDSLTFQAACAHYAVELADDVDTIARSHSVGAAANIDLESFSYEVTRHEEIFSTASEYLAIKKPEDWRSEKRTSVWAVDLEEYARDANRVRNEAASEPPTETDRLSDEVYKMKCHLSIDKATSLFVVIKDIMRLCADFERDFSVVDETTVVKPDYLGRAKLGLYELRAKVRAQAAFWNGPTINMDASAKAGIQYNPEYWNRIDKFLEEHVRTGILLEPPVATNWVALRDFISNELRPQVNEIVQRTLQMVERDISMAGDQFMVNHMAGNDLIYKMLCDGMLGGKKNRAPWSRVVRSRKQEIADAYSRQFDRSERKTQKMRLTGRHRAWCRVMREEVLQYVRQAKQLKVERCESTGVGSRLSHQHVDRWHQARLKELDDGEGLVKGTDGTEKGLRCWRRSLPPIFFSQQDTVLLSLTLKSSDPNYDKLMHCTNDVVEYSQELEDLLHTIDSDLDVIVGGVERIQELSMQEDSYHTWASFDPLMSPPRYNYDPVTPTATFFFAVHLYRTWDSHRQWLAWVFAGSVGRAALKFRLEAMRIFEQSPFVTQGMVGGSSDETVGEERYYRTVYRLQDLGITDCATPVKRDRSILLPDGSSKPVAQECRDSWIGLVLPCFERSTGKAAPQRSGHRGYTAVFGDWHKQLSNSICSIERLISQRSPSSAYVV